jgi:hypothetical protein
MRTITHLLRGLALAAALLPIVSAVEARAQSRFVPPRTADGHPDLQGIWQALNTASWDIQDHGASLGVPAGFSVVEGNDIPYQDWARARKHQNFAARTTTDPVRRCYLPGVPRITYMPYPFQIVQSRDKVNILYEYNHALRHIHLTGLPHPDGPLEWWMGDSRGRWEGDTLVVDVVHFTGETWLDAAGNFHSEALRVVERYTRIGPDHMLYEATLEDPNVFTRPWKMSMTLYRRQEPDVELLEYECHAYLIEEEWDRR